MPPVPHILAADEGDLLFKILFFLVAAVIWALSQLVGWLNSKKDKTLPPSRPRPQQQRQPTAYRTPAEQPSRPPPLQRRQQQTPVLQRPPAMKPQRKPKPRPVPVPEPVAQPAYTAQRAVETMQAVATQAREATAARQAVAKPGDTLPRRQMLDALLRPRNLRKAFVVTELLGPPVALRPENQTT